MSVTVTGMLDLKKTLGKFKQNFKKEADYMTNRIMLKIEREGAIQAPVVSGRLRGSIYSKLVGFSNQSFVSTNTNYAVFPHIRGRNPNYMGKAVNNSSMFIKREVDNMLDRLLK